MENPKEMKLESLGGWIVSSPDFIFNMRDVVFIHKNGNNISIAMQGNTLNISISNDKASDEYYKWLSDYKIKFHQAMQKNFIESSALQKASVEIQNKFAGKMIDAHT